jgi:transposase
MSMIQRAVYKGKRRDRHIYKNIKVCAAWLKFENFIKDMGSRPSKKHTLDRWPKPLLGYRPGNCRWATAEEQAASTKSAKMLTLGGQTLPTSAWARKAGIGRATIQHRLAQGWSTNDALTVPAGESNQTHMTFAKGRQRGRKLSAAKVTKMMEEARAGATATSLGKKYGVSCPAVCHIAKQFGVKFKKGRPKL